MRLVFLTLTAVIVACTPVLAADKGPIHADEIGRPEIAKSGSGFSGCHIHASVGIGIADVDLSGAGAAVTFGDSSATGGVGAGCDVAISSRVIVGAVARYDFSDLAGRTIGDGGGSLSVRQRGAWSVAGRLGYVPMNDVLFYGVAGFAGSTVRSSVRIDDVASTDSSTLGGLLLGAGVEIKLTPQWSTLVEYNRVDFGDESGVDPTLHTVRSGIVFRF